MPRPSLPRRSQRACRRLPRDPARRPAPAVCPERLLPPLSPSSSSCSCSSPSWSWEPRSKPMADDPPVVVDAHTHAFPPEWIADRINHCQRDRWFGELYEAPSAKMIDAGELLAAMDAAGVDSAIVCGWPWADPGLCREHNDYMAAASNASSGRLSWLGTVAPASPGADAETERCLALGASGIGELNADAQGVDLTLTE